ncbi:ABC transporter permease [Chengkuizengella sediminis]|uniref:ABC transporter permease n=1 Tax=Chengkuizengella sediminis TaxID=1885917 RepID=UPI00138A68C0|nr:ABC transporter permease subunit [Chengkuizengella sediminis]NDI34928.1 ABC transporter permease subunit [Chengkuizengella sediminis]
MKTPIVKFTMKTILYVIAMFIIFGPLSSLILWSFAEKWYWPHMFPQEYGFFYWKKVLDADILNSLFLSFGIGIIVTILTLVLTVPMSYVLARYKIPARAIILMIFLLPQAFPQIPVFTNTMVLMYKWDLVGTIPGVILIHLVGALVFSVWTLVSVFKSIPVSYEEAAFNMGASKLRVFFTITLPIAIPGIVAASLLVFLYSLDEFTGSLLIGSPFVVTMPIYMYNSAMGYEMQIASITALLLMIPGIIMLFLLDRYLKSEYLAAFGR